MSARADLRCRRRRQPRLHDVDNERGPTIGEDESARIGDVVAVDAREAGVGRTALLIGGLTYRIAYPIAIAMRTARMSHAG